MKRQGGAYIFLSALALACFESSSTHAYELATHGALTYEAFKRSILNPNPNDPQDPQLLSKVLGIKNGVNPFGDIYYDVSGTDARERKVALFEQDKNRMPEGTRPLSVEGWLMRGAIREDDWRGIDVPGCRVVAPNPVEENLDRPINHFYDPFHDRPLAIPGARKAPDWALGTSDVFRNPNTPEPGRPNNFTVFDAREAMYRALTGRNKDNQEIAKTIADRDKYWAT